MIWLAVAAAGPTRALRAMSDAWPPLLLAKFRRLAAARYHYRPETDDLYKLESGVVVTRAARAAITDDEIVAKAPGPTGLAIGFHG